MIQRSKLGLKFFSPAFSMPCLSSGPVNRSDAWHITVALPAQKGCAQTISANVLKMSFPWFFQFKVKFSTCINHVALKRWKLKRSCALALTAGMRRLSENYNIWIIIVFYTGIYFNLEICYTWQVRLQSYLDLVPACIIRHTLTDRAINILR